MDGFAAHPAALDVATHFGAVFDTDKPFETSGRTPGRFSEQEAQAPPTARVPMAVGAYSISNAGRTSHENGSYASGDAAVVSSSGTRVNAFRVCGSASSAVLSDWQARPLRISLPAASADRPGALDTASAIEIATLRRQLASTTHIYETQWQVSMPADHVMGTPVDYVIAGESRSRSCGSARLRWQLQGSSESKGGMTRELRGSIRFSRDPASSCAAMLRLLQLPAAQRRWLTLSVSAPPQCSISCGEREHHPVEQAANTAYILAAMARSAAAERSLVQCQLASGDCGRNVARLPAGEAECRHAAGAMYLPRSPSCQPPYTRTGRSMLRQYSEPGSPFAIDCEPSA